MNENILYSDASLIDAIRTIEKTSKRLAVVLSEDYHVLGTISDGDIRRYILQNIELEEQDS